MDRGQRQSSLPMPRIKCVTGILEGRFGTQKNWAGSYRMTCSTSTSWCGFAKRIFTCAGKLLNSKSPLVIPIPSKDYPSLAKRLYNSALSNVKLEDRFATQLPPRDIALDAVIQKPSKIQRHNRTNAVASCTWSGGTSCGQKPSRMKGEAKRQAAFAGRMQTRSV